MKIITSDNILQNNYLDFDRSKQAMSVAESEELIQHKALLSYLFAEESEFELKSFLRFFSKKALLAGKQLYLIFSDSFPEEKNRIRSYQKLFYKEYDKLGRENCVEKEVDLPNNQSILIGLVKVDGENLEYALQKLYTSQFTFGLITEGRKAAIWNEAFLEKVVSHYLDINKRRLLNPLKLALGVVDEEVAAFRLSLHGNNDQSVDVFLHKKAVDDYVRLGKEFLVEKETMLLN